MKFSKVSMHYLSQIQHITLYAADISQSGRQYVKLKQH